MLIRAAGGDGNVLLNVGPRPDGVIDPLQANRLKEMGQWLAKYGESIYATRGGPYKPASWGVSTRKGNKVFLHVIKWPSDAFLSSLTYAGEVTVRGGREPSAASGEFSGMICEKAFPAIPAKRPFSGINGGDRGLTRSCIGSGDDRAA